MSVIHRAIPLLFVLLVVLMGAGCAAEPAYPSCRNDSACRRGGERAYCLGGQCQQCRAAADCRAGSQCDEGRCVQAAIARAECSNDAACGAGRSCVGGRCVASAGDLVARSVDGRGACVFATVHFGYDDAEMPAADRAPLQRTADCLRAEGDTRYVLLGRADPRGTSEYNLALGARRARAVQSYLVALGIASSRLAPSSLGSEGASGTDEASWAQDRRVDPDRREPASMQHGAHAGATSH